MKGTLSNDTIFDSVFVSAAKADLLHTNDDFGSQETSNRSETICRVPVLGRPAVCAQASHTNNSFPHVYFMSFVFIKTDACKKITNRSSKSVQFRSLSAFEAHIYTRTSSTSYYFSPVPPHHALCACGLQSYRIPFHFKIK